jgi:alkylation response protein AidB-like acyl-CoA dehydrogenase
VDLLATPEQEELARAAARLIEERFPRERLRALFDKPSSLDDGLWSAAAAAGWFALGIPESHGGAGGRLADEILVFRELGRCLASGPFLSTVLAARVAAFAGNGALARAVMEGAPVGLAITADEGSRDGSGGELVLVDAVGTGHVLFTDEGSAALYAVGDLGPIRAVPCVDPAVRLARVHPDRLVSVATTPAGVDQVWLRGQVLVAAMLVGVAERARDMAVEHARTRVQFDRPIGVNQAVKHPCADMAVRCELAWAQTVVSACCLDEAREDAQFQALAAREVAGSAAERNAAAMLQIHGAMGFTFEHDAHLVVKRAFVLNSMLGSRRKILSRMIGLRVLT